VFVLCFLKNTWHRGNINLFKDGIAITAIFRFGSGWFSKPKSLSHSLASSSQGGLGPGGAACYYVCRECCEIRFGARRLVDVCALGEGGQGAAACHAEGLLRRTAALRVRNTKAAQKYGWKYGCQRTMAAEAPSTTSRDICVHSTIRFLEKVKQLRHLHQARLYLSWKKLRRLLLACCHPQAR
jgi:hypothetical protein